MSLTDMFRLLIKSAFTDNAISRTILIGSCGMSMLFASSFAFAWGGRGHAAICDAAVHLVKEKELREFLISRGHTMGHLCNVPDIYWKSLGGDVRPVGDPTHYINPEVVGVTAKTLTLDLNKLITEWQGKPSATDGSLLRSLPSQMGTIWWRADQFYRRAISNKADFAKLSHPLDRKQEQDEKLPFNSMVYDFMVNLGLMGHFVGDASQPLHNTHDHDAWAAKKGGLHSYYEDAVVAQSGPDLVAKIVRQGKSQQQKKALAYLNEKSSVLERMRQLSTFALTHLPKLLAADKVLEPSVQREERGMQLRTPAKRRPAAETYAGFEPLFLQEMGASAALLAQIWDQAYREIGSPELSKYKSFRYPFTPDFVVPDYFEAPTSRK